MDRELGLREQLRLALELNGRTGKRSDQITEQSDQSNIKHAASKFGRASAEHVQVPLDPQLLNQLASELLGELADLQRIGQDLGSTSLSGTTDSTGAPYVSRVSTNDVIRDTMVLISFSSNSPSSLLF